MKTFLSIGSGSGVAFATAARFAREGFQIVLSSRNPAKAQEVADRLKAKGSRVWVRTVDSSDPESVAALIADVQRQVGPVVEVPIKPNSKDAEAVGELFWQLHSQPIGSWTAEVNYSG
jgi:NAD(P)-dependent dehydrogenase (short-subunit alcohol dehydrogenase family)